MYGFSILRIFILFITFAITFLLTYVALVPTYVLQIHVNPRINITPQVEVTEETIISFYNGDEPIIIDLAGKINNPVIPRLLLEIRSPASMESQTSVIPVSGAYLSTPIQVISRAGSITHGSSYSYKLYSMNNNLMVSGGNIEVEIKAVISGASPWFMFVTSFLGLLAAFMQTIDLSRQYIQNKKSQNAQTTNPPNK